MSKKSCVRTPFESQHPNGSKTLFKSERQYFYQIFSALWEKWSWKMSLSVIYELLGLFVNTFTVNDKNFLCNSENLRQRIQMQLSKNPRSFIKFLLHLWILQSEFKYFEKKVTLIAGVIPKSQTVEAVVNKCLKSPVSEHPVTVNMLMGPKHMWNLHDSTVIIIFHPYEPKLLGKCLC